MIMFHLDRFIGVGKASMEKEREHSPKRETIIITDENKIQYVLGLVRPQADTKGRSEWAQQEVVHVKTNYKKTKQTKRKRTGMYTGDIITL